MIRAALAGRPKLNVAGELHFYREERHLRLVVILAGAPLAGLARKVEDAFRVENEEGVVQFPVKALRPDDPRAAGLRQLDLYQQPLGGAPH